jgi:phosphate starvation-inducible PhoH-like protein
VADRVFGLNGIHPLDFFGPDNEIFNNLRSTFPKVKLTLRGDELKASAEEAELDVFGQHFEEMLSSFEEYGSPVIQSENKANDSGLGTSHAIGQANVLLIGNGGVAIKARTANQKAMVAASESSDIVFAVGPAGTGKSYTAVALAVRALRQKQVKKIVLTRPAVEAGESLGFLPGDLKEKIDPYLRPLYDALNDMIPHAKLEQMIADDIIEIAPLAFMRGRTLDKAFVILDEAQNTTESQIKMFLTRMGPSAKFIITGDLSQIDLPRNQRSGLVQALRLLKEVNGIRVIQLTADDVVRHRLVKEIVRAYERADEILPNEK